MPLRQRQKIQKLLRGQYLTGPRADKNHNRKGVIL